VLSSAVVGAWSGDSWRDRGGLAPRRQDKARRDEGAEGRRRSDVGTFIRCCVFLMFVELGSHISGVDAVGPSLGFLRKVSLCSAGSYSATAGTHSSATISNCKKNRPENPATPTNKGGANNKK
jgi:hypothetical protein